MKCDAKGCKKQIKPYDIHRTMSGGYIHGVNLCKEHKNLLDGVKCKD